MNALRIFRLVKERNKEAIQIDKERFILVRTVDKSGELGVVLSYL